ncbi:PAS-domain containing protein [Albirhodobacter sp. R86504]|uniref:PAS-domain containing protein n=1 Tax=Albirhodobacter sp. R86504 TaxID=3093848 RepID=UPI0036719C69
MDHWILAVIIVTTSVASAVVALMILAATGSTRKSAALRLSTGDRLEQTVFLFDGEDLLDATASAHRLLEVAPVAHTDWARLAAFLIPRFTNFLQTMGRLAEEGRLEMSSRLSPGEHAPIRLVAESVNGMARITLIDPDAEGHGVLVDGLSQRALEDELDLLRNTVDRAPILAWRESSDGSVTWANRAYILRSGALNLTDDVLAWPLPRIFANTPMGTGTVPRRLKVDGDDDRVHWYECHSQLLENGALHFALPSDSPDRAERSLREFVNTLSKAFADLPIGLAIFDRQRTLEIFNPALLDLLGLSAEFLAVRPTLYAFFDHLREGRVMPEPKNYRSWRQQMSALEKAASSGDHTEIWSLPSGQTYRVTGRPHPDGAIAFLFDDISSEISLTRRFRADLELGNEVLDTLGEAIAVFQSSGDLILSNAAYVRMWGVDPSETLGRTLISDAIKGWKSHCEEAEAFSKIQEFADQLGKREPWSHTITRKNGLVLTCRVVPMSAGGTLIGFSLPSSVSSAGEPLCAEHQRILS